MRIYFQQLINRLLRIPLFYKILLGNLAIVTLGATAGTVITVWHVLAYPDDIHYELIGVFALIGVVISFFVNNWVIQRALEPLDRLQDAVDQVRRGADDIRVTLGSIRDERSERLADTFNQMLIRLEQNTLEMQQLSRRILQAQEEERARLSRELHDEAAQALTSLLVHLRLLERTQEPADAQRRVQELRELTAAALENVRRVALDLRPKILDDLGLVPALEWRVDELNSLDGIHASFQAKGFEQRLPRHIELSLYRIGQESLSNVARHAQASEVSVSLMQADDEVVLSVSDNGCGFHPDLLVSHQPRGLGLLGMRERVAMIGGKLEILSQRGQGTHVRASVPLQGINISHSEDEVPAESLD